MTLNHCRLYMSPILLIVSHVGGMLHWSANCKALFASSHMQEHQSALFGDTPDSRCTPHSHSSSQVSLQQWHSNLQPQFDAASSAAHQHHATSLRPADATDPAYQHPLS